MAKLTVVSSLTLWLALSLLISIHGTKGEVVNVVGNNNGRRLLQGDEEGAAKNFDGSSASASATASVTASEAPGADDDRLSIGFRGEDDTVYCTRCPEESKCDVCCCYDGECVDPQQAEEGSADCLVLEVAGSPVTSDQCSRCERSGCNVFHWCR